MPGICFWGNIELLLVEDDIQFYTGVKMFMVHRCTRSHAKMEQRFVNYSFLTENKKARYIYKMYMPRATKK